MTAISTISTEEFDRRFDEGEELDEFLDMANPVVRRAGDVRPTSLDLPGWLADAIEEEARHLAMPSKYVIVTWLADRAKQEHPVAV